MSPTFISSYICDLTAIVLNILTHSSHAHIEGELKVNRNINLLCICALMIVNLLHLWYYMYGCHQQTKRGRLKEQSCPYIMFWCWWQYTCRGLTMFVKWISGVSPRFIKGVWIMSIRSWFYSRKKYQNDYIFVFLSIGSRTIKRGSIGLVKGLLLPQTSLPHTHA